MNSRTWKSIEEIKEHRRGPTAVAHDSQVYVFGGSDGSEFPGYETSYRCFVSDTELKTWGRLPNMIVDREAGASVVYYA
jgi:N-acetylneuraminic acid mutarotase